MTTCAPEQARIALDHVASRRVWTQRFAAAKTNAELFEKHRNVIEGKPLSEEADEYRQRAEKQHVERCHSQSSVTCHASRS
jgi:hypothetical protein